MTFKQRPKEVLFKLDCKYLKTCKYDLSAQLKNTCRPPLQLSIWTSMLGISSFYKLIFSHIWILLPKKSKKNYAD